MLANEEITADGRSAIGNYPVFRRPMRQWMLRITAYAGRLLDDLDLLDWPEPIKVMQRNWIGPSDGASIDFEVSGAPDVTIQVFTTRPDTLPGATYLVLAPDHPPADSLVADAWPETTPREWRYLAAEGQAQPLAAPRGRASVITGRQWTPVAAVQAYRKLAAKLVDRDRTRGSGGKTGVFGPVISQGHEHQPPAEPDRYPPPQ